MNLETLVLPLKTEDNAFRAGLSRSIQLVQGAIEGIEKVVESTFKWADELDSIGDKMDTTNRTAAAYNFVLRKSGVATETFTKGMVILGKGLVDATGKLDTTGKELKEWGIDVLDVNGVLKDQDTLIAEVADKYASFSTQQERVNFLTGVFGRSGADLVDFFDTLAAEGGIDAVTKKVEQLGLAIDPGRYEQFNRNLEEMKLIGLGLAVGFTEQLMPVLEDLTQWVMDVGIPAFMEFKDGVISAFQSGGIGEALSFIDTEIATWLDSLDWAGWGSQFGDLIESALGGGIGEVDLPQFAISLGEGIKSFLIAAVGEENIRVFKEHFVDYIILQLNQLDVSMNAIVRGAFAKMGVAIEEKLVSIDVAFANWSVDVGNQIKQWGANMLSNVVSTMSSLQANIAAKLAAISENFQQRASSWLKKAAEVFNDTKGVLITAVSNLVGEINAELRKIIQSVTLSIRTVINGGSMGTAGTAGTSSLGGGGGPAPGDTVNTIGGRASGGPVIGGKAYSVAEFFRPEVFTPAVNGRIDPISNTNQPQGVMILNWDDLDYSRLATELVKAEVNK
jgi:hypothetical protein